MPWWLLKWLWRSLVTELRAGVRNLGALPRFVSGYLRYARLAGPEGRPRARHLYPCLGDDVGVTAIEPTYFYQDAWAFERIVEARPAAHLDVGSHHKYVALLSKVVPVTMVDIRPLSLPMESLRFQAGSILALPYPDRSVASLSSLCVVEHIGLGRYGDPIDPAGAWKALDELKRVMAENGDLYVSVPIHDTPRVYFNAHRAFSEAELLARVAPLELVQARYIYGERFVEAREKGLGIGCYHLRRPPRP